MRRLALVALVALLLGCGRGDGDDRSTLNVFAASSLTEAFTDLAEQFEASHSDLDVRLNFAASSALAQQVSQGAPADVLATADRQTIDLLVGTGKVRPPSVIARNRLALIVEQGNPKAIAELADLARPGVVFVVCAAEVPCGRFAALALHKAGVTGAPTSLEGNVKGVVAKVTLGEADAGIVYATDVKAAGDEATGVPIAGADDPALAAVYPMAVVADTANRKVADAWCTFVRSARGRQTLARFGFLAP